MNKAKIFLSALGVLLLVGSALAFKAHKAYSGNLRCSLVTTATTTTSTLSVCTELSFSPTTLPTAAIRFCTHREAPFNEPCFATTRVVFNQ